MNNLSINNDFNVFKDETLQTLRQIEKQLLEKIQLKYTEIESKISQYDSKISKCQEFSKMIYDSFTEQKINSDKIDDLNEFKSKTESRFISVESKLKNFCAEIVGIKNKYNRLSSEISSVPGVIGSTCKYSSISDFIIDNINFNKQLDKEKNIIKKQLDELKTKNDSLDIKLNYSVDKSVYSCKLYTDIKFNELKNFYNEKFDELNRVLINTKVKKEENVLKNEEIIDNIKKEVKDMKDEINNVFDEKNKFIETIKHDVIMKDNEMKTELNEITKK